MSLLNRITACRVPDGPNDRFREESGRLESADLG